MRAMYLIAVAAMLARGAVALEPVESDFFTDTIGSVDRTVSVFDYGADGSDELDDSAALQAAIDAMTALPNGGRITIPAGTYYFTEVLLKSNVHLEIAAGTRILPIEPKKGAYAIFRMGDVGGVTSLEQVENVSIRGDGGRFIVDLSHVSNIRGLAVSCKRVNNFMIADMDVLDSLTLYSNIQLAFSQYQGQYGCPSNGVVKNCSTFHSQLGYGMVQVQVGRNLLFKNLHGDGGATLRLESGSGETAYAPADLIIDNVWGRDISAANGRSATMISPHSRKNGYFDIDRVTATNCIFAHTDDLGDRKEERNPGDLTPGWFANTSKISNIHAVYGTSAHLKYGHIPYIPCELRGLISEKTIYTKVFSGPSAAAVQHRSDGPGEGTYTINISQVTQSGFTHQPKTILTLADRKRDCHEN